MGFVECQLGGMYSVRVGSRNDGKMDGFTYITRFLRGFLNGTVETVPSGPLARNVRWRI